MEQQRVRKVKEEVNEKKFSYGACVAEGCIIGRLLEGMMAINVNKSTQIELRKMMRHSANVFAVLERSRTNISFNIQGLIFERQIYLIYSMEYTCEP